MLRRICLFTNKLVSKFLKLHIIYSNLLFGLEKKCRYNINKKIFVIKSKCYKIFHYSQQKCEKGIYVATTSTHQQE